MRTVPEADPHATIAFVAVVEHRSFRGAARALGIPKSTLSQRVAGLEAHFGTTLLTRTTRTVALTEVGERYHREVAPVLEALRAAEASVASTRTHPSGRLRLTAPFELGQRALGPVLAAYAARCPDVAVELVLLDRQVSLVDEGFDLALRVGPLADSGLVARKVGPPGHVGVYGSPAYLARAKTPRAPADLSAHRCLVMTSTRDPLAWPFAGPRGGVKVAVRGALSANSFEVLAHLAAAGQGLARLPEAYARSLPAGAVREVLRRHALPARQTFAVYPSARHPSPALRAMVELLAERFQGPLDA